MGIDLVGSLLEGVNEVLRVLILEVGLGYSRVIYLEYNEEKDEFLVKNYVINFYILVNIEKYIEGINGFIF